jgi:hypothetical protein
MVFGLDQLVSEPEAERGETDAIREWFNREGTCRVVAPYHDVSKRALGQDSLRTHFGCRHGTDEPPPAVDSSLPAAPHNGERQVG